MQSRPSSWLVDVDAAAYVTEAFARLDRARTLRSGFVATRRVDFGGRRIELVGLGAAMSDAILPAFCGNGATGGSEAELEVVLADRRCDGVTLPSPDANDPEPVIVGRQRAVSRELVGALPRFEVYWEPPWVYGLDRTSRRAFYWAPDGLELPGWARTQPILRLLHTWAQSASLHILHAGCIGRGGRGVLLAGPGGSGKSTLSLSGLVHGLDYVGDDYVGVTDRQDIRQDVGQDVGQDLGGPPLAASDRFVAAPLYRFAKLTAANLAARLPSLEACVVESFRGWNDKLVIAIDGETSLTIAAIVLPRIVAAATTAGPTPIGPGRALRSLAPSSILQLPGYEKDDLAFMSRLTANLPAYELEVSDTAAALASLEALWTGGGS
jgi:hypothetical protein